MGLVLIKEDGTGKVDANAHVGDADVDHDGHLDATAWDTAKAEQRVKALVMATRLIDTECQFGGVRATIAAS